MASRYKDTEFRDERDVVVGPGVDAITITDKDFHFDRVLKIGEKVQEVEVDGEEDKNMWAVEDSDLAYLFSAAYKLHEYLGRSCTCSGVKQ